MIAFSNFKSCNYYSVNEHTRMFLIKSMWLNHFQNDRQLSLVLNLACQQNRLWDLYICMWINCILKYVRFLSLYWHSMFSFKCQFYCLELVVIKCLYFQRQQGNLELKGKAIRVLAVAGVATGLCYQEC